MSIDGKHFYRPRIVESDVPAVVEESVLNRLTPSALNILQSRIGVSSLNHIAQSKTERTASSAFRGVMPDGSSLVFSFEAGTPYVWHSLNSNPFRAADYLREKMNSNALLAGAFEMLPEMIGISLLAAQGSAFYEMRSL